MSQASHLIKAITSGEGMGQRIGHLRRKVPISAERVLAKTKAEGSVYEGENGITLFRFSDYDRRYMAFHTMILKAREVAHFLAVANVWSAAGLQEG